MKNMLEEKKNSKNFKHMNDMHFGCNLQKIIKNENNFF